MGADGTLFIKTLSISELPLWRNKTSQQAGRVPEDAGVPWPCQPSCSSKSRGVPPAWGWGRGEGGLPQAAGGSLSRDTAGRAPDSTYQAIPAMLDSIPWQLGNRGRERGSSEPPTKAGAAARPVVSRSHSRKLPGWLLPSSAARQMAGTWRGGSRGLCCRPPPTALEMSKHWLRKRSS